MIFMLIVRVLAVESPDADSVIRFDRNQTASQSQSGDSRKRSATQCDAELNGGSLSRSMWRGFGTQTAFTAGNQRKVGSTG